ncbi:MULTISPECIES: Sir2 family NAD-dependent protein deacetylase [Pseudofrankia]|uniref:Sir2 family NAD-dependent protein deacetylase n=1 Tax=Pseudofrankia TaxID=2994363 RepID=UPI00055F1AEB|nr:MULTISPECIES: Sir2 family NAD-dependent protein deacetylase [Pseudofrankia]OHV37165.1 NAD-dependent deacetylase [Pseudofrankia sp. EUN1h]
MALREAIAAAVGVTAGGGVAVLTGAGMSTESGIPDYRGPSGALRRNHAPMTYQQFTGDPAARRRYWARSHAGWRHIVDARPNSGHTAVAALEGADLLTGIVTQNVDGLHQAGGARSVVELHGSLARVLCSDCGDVSPRAELEARLAAANPDFRPEAVDAGVSGAEEPGPPEEWDGGGGPPAAAGEGGGAAGAAPPPAGRVNPDGDATLAEAEITRFAMVGCGRCGDGRLEPDVVFFGATVPRDRVAAAMDVVERSRLLLVLGSSLTVMSGYRFVLRAGKLGIPVAIVNQGPTRADARAALLVDAPLGDILPALAHELTVTS